MDPTAKKCGLGLPKPAILLAVLAETLCSKLSSTKVRTNSKNSQIKKL